MKSSKPFVLLGMLTMLTGAAHAQGIEQNNTNLPPAGVYTSSVDLFATYNGPGLSIELTGVQYVPLASGPPPVQRIPINGGVDEREEFGSTIDGLFSVNGGPLAPFSGSGLAQTITYGHGPLGSPIGTFQVEMISMDLSIGGGVLIRESPTLQSLGLTTITPIGGGMFHIDSFFDVFTELSIDGGSSWIPSSSGPTHITLGPQPVPEPGTLTLAGFGLAGLAALSWRRRK